MILFQFDSQNESFVVLVLEKANLDRMSQADPITLNPVSIGGWLAPITNPENLHLLVAYEPDSEKLNEVADNEPDDASRQRAIFKFVMRGFQVTDKDGPEGIAKGQREAEERRVRAENVLRKKLLEIIPDVSVPSMKHTIAERILVAVRELKRHP